MTQDTHRDEHDRIYHMIDGIGQSVQAVDMRVRSVEKIVSNGLQERTIRIEGKLDVQDAKIDALITEMHSLHRRVDGCVDEEVYIADRRKEWDGIERRNEATRAQQKEWTARVIIGVVLAVVGTAIGYLL